MTELLNTVTTFIAGHVWLRTLIWLVILVFSATVVNYLLRIVLLRGSFSLLSMIRPGEHNDLRDTVRHLGNIFPALVYSLGIAAIPDMPATLVTIIQNVANAFIIFTVTRAISSALNIIDTIYRNRPQSKLRPIKGLIQVAKIGLFFISGILILATLIDRSPLILLSGLGAMAAVLLLVFQDTLLSFVAGIQISSTDMVRVGDWIEIPNLGADGDVTEIALHTVKVQNFDKTITTVPIRKLVTDPFKNWRGMQESGGRRIKRSLFLDQTSINFLDSEMTERLSHNNLLKDYLEKKRKEINEWNQSPDNKGEIETNRRWLTNIGTFRAYVAAYLESHPGVHKGMTIMSRQLAPGPEGLPLEIYCFTNTVVWGQYEAIQSDIFDHLYAILPYFGLRVFQAPSGHDMQLAFSASEASVAKQKAKPKKVIKKAGDETTSSKS